MEEMNALEKQVNFTVFQDLMSFIMDTTKANNAQICAIREHCIFPFSIKENGEFQKKYGFMYLGELLERYEERFGMTLPEFRAIALALGYTKDLTPDDMFVGAQRVNFLKKVQRASASDIYLTGALYLLYEGQSIAGELETALRQAQYGKTEDILFAMSLFPDAEESFLHFKPLLLHLIGKKRTIPVMGNMRLFVWLISRIRPLVKSIRTKDMALFRALCALPKSFVKEGDKNHELLTKVGYTPLEIAYANMRAIWLTPAAERLSWNSIVTEKILINLFKEVFGTESQIPSEVYGQLAEWLKKYETFPIKCYGQDKLLCALSCGARIRSLETFQWFSAYAPPTHDAFREFDIMDSHWDSLAAMLTLQKYAEFFETLLYDELSTEDIKARISRFNQLTGQDYLEYSAEHSYWHNFSLLVKKDVIDLWQTFQGSVDAEGMSVKSQMIGHIKSYLRGMTTVQTFQFYKHFLPQYGFQGLSTYFSNDHIFRDSVASCSSSYNGSGSQVKLELDQEYLDDDMRRLLLYWLSEYFFAFETEYYIPLISEILDKEAVARLFSPEEQRALFDLAMAHSSLVKNSTVRLKERYLTAEEKDAEKAEQTALRLERERQEQLALEKEVRNRFTEITDGTMASLLLFIENYSRYSNKLEIADTAVYEYLLSIEDSRAMDTTEYVCLLKLCARLVDREKMCFAEAQKLITMMKEAPHNGKADFGSFAE